MDVVKAGGTASDVSLGEMPIAGKTGTTSDDRDIWFAAYSPYYTCTVWGGYDNHDTLPSGDLYQHVSQKTVDCDHESHPRKSSGQTV